MLSRNSTILQFAVCLLITAVMVLHSYAKPFNNWDEIGYVGSAISWSARSPLEAQRLTFHSLRDATSDSDFRELTNGSYRSAVYHDASTFALQLPFYEIKPVYVALVWVSWKLGSNPARATSAISAAAAGCLGLIIASILVRDLGWVGVIVYPLILVLGGILASGRFSTPDAVSALIVFAGLWLLRRCSSKTSELGLLLLCVAVGIRPDNIVLLFSCAMVLIFATIFERAIEIRIGRIAQFAILGMVISFVVGKLAGYYGWRVLIHHSFEQLVTSPHDLKLVRWTDYGHGLMNGIAWLVGSSGSSPQFPLFIVTTYLLTYFQVRRRDSLLLTAALFYMVVHFIFFPSGQERFFCGVETFVLVLGATSVYEYHKRGSRLTDQAPAASGSLEASGLAQQA
jgi:hypothetical protein